MVGRQIYLGHINLNAYIPWMVPRSVLFTTLDSDEFLEKRMQGRDICRAF